MKKPRARIVIMVCPSLKDRVLGWASVDLDLTKKISEGIHEESGTTDASGIKLGARIQGSERALVLCRHLLL